MHLSPPECRVLGVLVEKALTTPAQYPLSLNAVTVGCNQKNNRDPITSYDEEACFDAIDALRAKGLARTINHDGARVEKYRHVARETLSVSTEELVIMTELLLRGPQTPGELRTRASRMAPLETTGQVESILRTLAGRESPLVRELPASPGERATRWTQLLCPELHPLEPAARREAPVAGGAAATAPAVSAMGSRVEELERRLAALTEWARTNGFDG